MDRLPKQAASEVRNGGRERLPSERAPADIRDFSLKTPQSSGSSSSSPLPSTLAAGAWGGDGGGGSGVHGVVLPKRTGNKDGGGSDDVHERGQLPPETPPKAEEDTAWGREGTEDSVVPGSKEGPRAEKADRLGQGMAPKFTGEKIEVEHYGGVSGKGKGGKDDGTKVGSEQVGEKGEEGHARTGGEKMRVVEVTDLFRTMKGLKCALGEAYTCCFGRTEEVRSSAPKFLNLFAPHTTTCSWTPWQYPSWCDPWYPAGMNAISQRGNGLARGALALLAGGCVCRANGVQGRRLADNSYIHIDRTLMDVYVESAQASAE